MIYEGSRYENETVIRVIDWQGLANPAIYVRPNIDAASFPYQIYMVQQGDRLDNLAYAFYNNPELWFEIARANPEVFYPDDLPEGTLLRIPLG